MIKTQHAHWLSENIWPLVMMHMRLFIPMLSTWVQYNAEPSKVVLHLHFTNSLAIVLKRENNRCNCPLYYF